MSELTSSKVNDLAEEMGWTVDRAQGYVCRWWSVSAVWRRITFEPQTCNG
jgi:hypothetical protein